MTALLLSKEYEEIIVALMRKDKSNAKHDRKKAKQTANQAKPKKEIDHLLVDRLRVTWLVLMGAIALFLLLSLFSYDSNDPGWTIAQSQPQIRNYAGIVGAYTANIILAICGVFGFLIPFLLIYGVWQLFLERKNFAESSTLLMLMRFAGAILLIFAGSGLAQIAFSIFAIYMPEGAGGILGQEVAKYAVFYLSTAGSVLMLTVAFALGLTLFSGGFWIRLLAALIRFIVINLKDFFASSPEEKERKAAQRKIDQAEQEAQRQLRKEQKLLAKEEKKALALEKKQAQDLADDNKRTLFESSDLGINRPWEDTTRSSEPYDDELILTPTRKLPGQAQELELSRSEFHKDLKTKKIKNKTDKITGLPSLELLDDPNAVKEQVPKEFLQKMALLVEEKLADFGIQVKVVGSFPGPVITRFELELAPGVKVSKLSGLAQDLARSLSTARVRVVEVIPGKPYVGIELPNQKREMVRLKEVLSHKKFIDSSSPLTMGLGVDIAGIPETANLAKMPHLLVAGTTGSGKSVGVNAMIISMLYKSAPDDLRLIMIDPKMLELSIYEGIPHLLTPVVTDMNEAANALRWCVKEMDRRYELMAAAGVRNIAGLNEKILAAEKAGDPMKDPLWLKLRPGHEEQTPLLEKLPYIVVIADEFADMMMVVGKKVEELIARLAQKARAAGVHLILATQRPSVDVVTGLIKANIPTRIAFQVSSKIDSRTILDQQGAEQLLGHGDMLYLPPGTGVPMRVHGAFVDDDEVHRVVAAWKEMGEPEYIDSITASDEDSEGGDTESEDNDPLYDEAVKIVVETQRASISSIQRRLRIGYNRSARLIEEMESAGIVSEMQSNGMRDVLIKR
ncbi:DNA translocase FtsK [Caedibacter taeniospiralis]|uniref:DNA translocase FtsK n=1 Tax=Caedibacter taeniospiralis TaxID=28907 RepID=UPI0013025305|nr:DNA translocase FtsK [Caedibacter taeniospiralis]